MFISCDWGTSSFRLRLVDQTTHSIMAEVKNNEGIAEVHQQWKQQARPEEERLFFYQTIIATQLVKLQELVTFSLKDIPIIISGMASSNIGMVELPYKAMPFAVDGRDLEYKRIRATESFPYETLIISGVRTDHDVMRGEEIQLIGCDIVSDKEHIYILPGTHSKHVTVKNKQVTDFKTYMTGEFFHLLSHHSILSRSVEDDRQPWSSNNIQSFEEGVMQSTRDNLLHNAFLVRTNQLFEQFTKEASYHYLSGLLIGTELTSLTQGRIPLTIVGSELMRKYYMTALQRLGFHDVETVDVDTVLIKGHANMVQLL